MRCCLAVLFSVTLNRLLKDIKPGHHLTIRIEGDRVFLGFACALNRFLPVSSVPINSVINGRF
jgi:hypothetical protein